MQRTVPGGNNLINARQVLEKAGLTKGMRAGDFGCGGMAFFTLTAAGMVGDTGMVYAVDILKTVLRGVEERTKAQKIDNIKTVWSNLEVFGATKIPDESLDFGMLVNVLFQAERDGEILKECGRMIETGGKFLVIDWKREGAPFGPAMDERVAPADIKQIMQAIGFREMESFDAGPYHWAVVFVK